MKVNEMVRMVVIVVFLLPLLTGCGKGETPEQANNIEERVNESGLQQFALSRMQMGTYVTITAFGKDKDTVTNIISLAFERMDEIEDLMSTFKEDSELSMVNRKASSEIVPLTQDTFNVIKRAIEFSRLSGGAFDVTYRPLSHVWGAAGKSGKLPADEEIKKAHGLVGYKKIDLDVENRAMFFLQNGMELDLGGIAKGYAVDEAVEVLKVHGIENALVEAGGDLYALGTKSGGEPWRIGIQDPYNPDKEKFLGKLKIEDCAVATSGDYQRFSVINGKKYSHIINPLTGWPVENVPSVTVIATDTTTADALATTLSVMGAEEGVGLVGSIPGAEALMIVVVDDQLQYTRTPNFSAYEH